MAVRWYAGIASAGLLILFAYFPPEFRKSRTSMVPDTEDHAPSIQPITSCMESLRNLARGDYTMWHGLEPACTRADVSAAFGESKSDTDLYGNPGGAPTLYRAYPGVPASPYGAIVWYVGDMAVALQMHTVTPARPIEDQLGNPDAKDPSRMPGFKTMWIYASRGLTLHIDEGTGAIAWLYAYRQMTLAEFRSSWLSRVHILRHRVR